MSRKITAVLLTILAIAAAAPISVHGQQPPSNEELIRRARNKIQPGYPDLARRMNISGIVKVEVVVAPNGIVREARVVGGHPVLASAALDAAKKWRFEPASVESSGVIEFKFEPR